MFSFLSRVGELDFSHGQVGQVYYCPNWTLPDIVAPRILRLLRMRLASRRVCR